jgi:lysophospholipase L1-like esterase
MSTTTINLNNVENQIKDTTGLTWAIYGDSLSNDLASDYPAIVADVLGLVPTTYAVSGNRYSQQLVVIQGQIAGDANFFQNYDIVSIHLGINDYAGNITLGSITSAPSDANISGYLKSMIELILTSNPSVQLFVITPTEANGAGVVYKATNTAGYTLDALSKLVAQVCSYYGVQCIDLYNLVNFNLFTIPSLTTDGLHPSADGKELIARVVAYGFRNNSSFGIQQSLANADIKILNPERLVYLNGSTSSDKLHFRNASSNLLTVSGDGFVGVGQQQPTRMLHVGTRIAANSDGTFEWGQLLTSTTAKGKLTWDTNKAIVSSMQKLSFQVNNNIESLLIDELYNQVLGRQVVLSTAATNGFTYIPTCAGTPTGTPTTFTGKAAMVMDTTNNRLYIYSGGAWIAIN